MIVHTGENPYQCCHCDFIIAYNSIYSNDLWKQLKRDHINAISVKIIFTGNLSSVSYEYTHLEKVSSVQLL